MSYIGSLINAGRSSHVIPILLMVSVYAYTDMLATSSMVPTVHCLAKITFVLLLYFYMRKIIESTPIHIIPESPRIFPMNDNNNNDDDGESDGDDNGDVSTQCSIDYENRPKSQLKNMAGSRLYSVIHKEYGIV
jgi:hypothetical protein